ncbi:unnamed protein product [Dibothriocephalus latus]|uniref:Uncharacterized protein n=1 Tax=Dibothriocephalus latus TaxID=60516 RepID=A0A3P6S5G5_DIBLA|nr:unnamed protein product [Dibothriocephalus latus]
MKERMTELVGQVDNLKAECLAKESEKTDVLIQQAGLRNTLTEYESLQQNVSFVLTQKDTVLVEAKLTEISLQANWSWDGRTLDGNVYTQRGTEQKPAGLSDSARSVIQRWQSSSALDTFAELVLAKEGLQSSTHHD